MTQGIKEQIGPLAAIESEAHLFQVSGEMLGRYFVPSADDAALEQGESRFHGICVNIAADIFFRVADGLVELLLVHRESKGIDRGFVGKDDFHIFADVFCHYFANRLRGRGIDVKQSQFTVTLADADNNLLVGARESATGLAADVGLINLKNAVHHGLLAFDHGGTDSVAEIPGCFVAHSDRALNLAGGHTLLCFAEQVCGEKPLCKRQVGIVEHRAGSNRELIVTVFAVEELLFRFQLDHGSLAAQAARAFRPAETDEQFAAFIFGTEQGIYIN